MTLITAIRGLLGEHRQRTLLVSDTVECTSLNGTPTTSPGPSRQLSLRTPSLSCNMRSATKPSGHGEAPEMKTEVGPGRVLQIAAFPSRAIVMDTDPRDEDCEATKASLDGLSQLAG